MTSDRDVRNALIEHLGADEVPYDDLLAAVREVAPADRTDRIVQRLLQRDMSFADLDGNVCYVPGLVDATSWTCFVDAGDAAEGFVRMQPSLSPLVWWLVTTGADLVDQAGEPAGEVHTDGFWIDGHDTDVLIGPDGWLDAVAGQRATLSVSDERLCISRCDEPPQATRRQIDAITAGFERTATSEQAQLFDEEVVELNYAPTEQAVLAALLHDRDAFVEAAIPELTDLYAAAGLEERNQTLATIGFDWEALDTRHKRNRMRVRYGLDERQIDALTLLIGAGELFAEVGESAFGPTDGEREGSAMLLAALLGDARVGEAFLTEMLSRRGTPDTIEQFADAAARSLPDSGLVGAAWIRAQCMTMRGDIRDAVALIDTLAGPRCDHEGVLVDAAAAMSDRGDAPETVRLLARAGTTEASLRGIDPDADYLDEQTRLLIEVLPYARNRPKATAGRNDPCPCGSGRKYKLCHLGRERHDLTDRSSWLYDKAVRAIRHRAPTELHDLATDLSRGSYETARALSASPFVADLALHELDMMSEFLDERGWLLPEDEQLLATQWKLVDRSVFEILEHHRDDALVLRDIGRGETIVVTNTHHSDASRPGLLLVGRPLPVGDTYRAFGGFMAVSPRLVNPLLDVIADDNFEGLVDVLAQVFGPPEIRNTAGEVLAFHVMRWHLDAIDDLHARLTGVGFVGDDDGEWSLTEDTSGMRNAILATLRFDGDARVLTAEANSDERAANVRQRVERALPTARLIDDERSELHDVRADAADTPDDASGLLDPNDPAIRALMDEMIRGKEIEWLDLEIPALGGRTPREAVTDPIGRAEVRALLASFPEASPDDVSGFRPSRLRALLDLDE